MDDPKALITVAGGIISNLLSPVGNRVSVFDLVQYVSLGAFLFGGLETSPLTIGCIEILLIPCLFRTVQTSTVSIFRPRAIFC